MYVSKATRNISHKSNIETAITYPKHTEISGPFSLVGFTYQRQPPLLHLTISSHVSVSPFFWYTGMPLQVSSVGSKVPLTYLLLSMVAPEMIIEPALAGRSVYTTHTHTEEYKYVD